MARWSKWKNVQRCVNYDAHTNYFQDNTAGSLISGPNVYCKECGDCPPTKNYVGAPFQCPNAGAELFTPLPIFFVIAIMLVTLHKIVQNANLGDGNVYSDVTHAITIQAKVADVEVPASHAPHLGSETLRMVTS